MAARKKLDAGLAEIQEITIPQARFGVLTITLKGLSPLIVHKFGAKVRKQMLDKQMKVAKVAREAKDPDADFRESLYVIKEGVYGFPASGFKGAAVSACSFVDGITKVKARGAFHVVGDLIEIEGSKPERREDAVRINGQTADIRYRAQFLTWRCTLQIRYNASVISPAQIVNLFNHAGFSVGLGDWRPQRNGSFGMFEVEAGEAR